MANRELHVELLLGREVFDSEGALLGRLEEVIAAREGDAWVVEEFWVGSGALLHRLSARGAGRAVLCLFGVRESEGYKVPWDKLDFSRTKRLSLNCPRRELERLTIGEKTSRQRKRKTRKGKK